MNFTIQLTISGVTEKGIQFNNSLSFNVDEDTYDKIKYMLENPQIPEDSLKYANIELVAQVLSKYISGKMYNKILLDLSKEAKNKGQISNNQIYSALEGVFISQEKINQILKEIYNK
jgi:uncharacterized protein YneF (UPF0154 family)